LIQENKAALKRKGIVVNNKKVLKLMKKWVYSAEKPINLELPPTAAIT
jgi:hypothetical protein